MKNSEEENEPKEMDKMNPTKNGDKLKDNVESQYPKKTPRDIFQERLQSAKTVIEKRYSIIILLLALLSFLLLLIVIILAVQLAIHTTEPVNLCENSDCLRAASSVMSSLNTTIDPCDDFWSYSCDTWIKNHPLPKKRNQGSISLEDTVIESINQDIRHQIDLIWTKDSRSPEYKLKKFYESCMDMDEIDYGSETWIKRQINEIGGWSITKDFSLSNFDRQIVLQRLQVKYGVTPFFKISADVDDFHPSASIIKIEPSGLGLPNRNYYYDARYEKIATAYKQYMKDLAKQFGATNIAANNFADAMFQYEKRIAGITPYPKESSKPSKVLQKMRLRTLRNMATTIGWVPILQSHFENYNVRDTTNVIVAYPDYFKNLSHIISTTDNNALNDYLMWRFLSSYVPYLSKPFRVIANEFEQAMNGIEGTSLKMKEERWEYCIRLTSKLMGYAVGSLYLKSRPDHKNTEILEAKEIVKSIKAALIKNVDKISWAKDKSSKNNIREKIEALNWESSIGYPEFVTNERKLSAYYNKFNVENNFLKNIVKSIYFLSSEMEMKLKTATSPESSWPIIPTDVSALYKYNGNQLFVASGLLRNPIFDTGMPTAMKFGSLGFKIASEIMNAINPIGVQYESFGKLVETSIAEKWLKEDSLTALNDTSSCLLEYLESDPGFSNNMEVNSKMVLSQTLSDIGALQLIYNAYHEYKRKNGDEGILPGFYRSNNELLFVAYAQSMCENIRDGKAKATYGSLDTLPAQQRVNILLHHVPEFGRNFQCKNDYSNACTVF